MKTSRIAMLGLGSVCLAFSLGASAAGQMSDSSHITNGGTGYIGLTESAGQPRTMRARPMATLPAGEATTMVGGRPNVDPNAPSRMAGWNGDLTRSMGASPSTRPASMGSATMGGSMSTDMPHPMMWGTPD